ncbi:hypothetical protein FQV39_32290 (plasmid) [Bosea sp. F3-2]|uniref:aldose epimerase family protein n=1 Tax=Bosea sp. F3-2 TaxID=2599640 RepID=UPI0011F033E4|nr:hypothetical protein [Bosea sp. F3-2]QEL27297.1 hypothetical protein FQV39_32290 [Bosea sp. F3-2]
MKHDDIELSAAGTGLVLRPSWGGRVVSLVQEALGDVLVPIVAEAFAPEAWPKGGAYPLVPFHNRVRFGHFDFVRSGQLPIHPESDPNALHGMGSRAVWRAGVIRSDHAELVWSHETSAAWPWTFQATQEFRLEPRRLTLTMRVTNRDTVDMPAGLGWHPYFSPSLKPRVEAKTIWPLDEHYLPRGHSEPAPVRLDRATAYLSDWQRVEFDNKRGKLVLTAEGLDHLVVHVPGASYACIEPVSHLAGALNEPWRRPGSLEGGMTRLAPGESITGQVALAFAQR